MKKILPGLLMGLVVLAFGAGKARALEIKNGENLTLEAKTSFDESLVVWGGNLVIESKVDGDLICAGRKIEIRGTVTGDVLCAGQSIKITGTVEGDVRVAGQLITLEGEIGKNVNAFAQDVVIGRTAQIGGELYTAGADVTFEGQLKRGWTANAENVTINGTVGDDATLNTTYLHMGQMAYMMGRLDYTSNNEASITPGARMMGGIYRVAPATKDGEPVTLRARRNFWMIPSTATNGFMMAGKIVAKLMMGIFGLLFVWLLPKWLRKTIKVTEDDPGQSALWGLVIIVLAPVAIMLTMMSLVGIPLAMLMIPAFILLIAVAHVVVAGFLGVRIMPKKTALIWSWLVGYLILAVVGWIPVIGGLIYLAATIVGLGAIKLAIFKAHK